MKIQKLGSTNDQLAQILLFPGMALQEHEMDTKTEQTPEPARTAPVTEVAARRRFLKGTTLALPAVVTLHSGTALATTSLGCGGQGNLVQTAAPVVTTQDTYMRQSVALFPVFTIDTTNYRIRSGANTPYFFKGMTVWRYVSNGLEVTANEKTVLDFLAAGTPPSTTTPTINSNTTLTIGGQPYKFRGPTSGTTWSWLTCGTGLALVNLNNSGATVSVGSPPVQGQTYITSLTGACFQSLMNRNQLV